MTEYFEVHERDGAARLGELRLPESITTPAVVDDVDRDPEPTAPAGAGPYPVVQDAGSLWTADRTVPESNGRDDRVTILPHRSFPAGTRAEVQESFAVDYPDVDYPSAAVVTAETARDYGTDVYVLSDLPGTVGHAAAFVETVIEAREALPADTALFLSGAATPANLPTLVYAGIDLVDPSRVRALGRQGKYLTSDGEHFLEDLSELPCSCPACRDGIEEFDRGDCAAHNVAALAAELATVRRRIREGTLRNYIEGQARHAAWHTAAFRELDAEYAYLEQRTPLVRTAEVLAASDDTLRRVEIQRFADRVTSRYRNRFSNPLVLVPCSARKPYSESQSHAQFHRAIQYRGHLASITSPIGVVPQELELTYPAQHYDAVVTGNWTETEIDFVARVLGRYLDRNNYSRVIAHIPPGGYWDICERVEDEVDAPFEYTVEDHPTTDGSLANLRGALDGELKYGKRERQHNTVRAIADYQFGDGAGDDLFETIQTESRYPKLRVLDADGDQLAAMVPEYGVLAFTLAGARRWVESDVPVKRVEIDDFVPHGSVLAPGVLDATEDVRIGDDVIVEGPSAFGVGRAQMSGPEMTESSRGVAVQVRHVEER